MKYKFRRDGNDSSVQIIKGKNKETLNISSPIPTSNLIETSNVIDYLQIKPKKHNIVRLNNDSYI